ncbi:8-oxo-dGTP pyrophosphatase MutT (NUDIX family) [Nocardia sp. GAS34]
MLSWVDHVGTEFGTTRPVTATALGLTGRSDAVRLIREEFGLPHDEAARTSLGTSLLGGRTRITCGIDADEVARRQRVSLGAIPQLELLDVLMGLYLELEWWPQVFQPRAERGDLQFLHADHLLNVSKCLQDC